MVVRWPRAGWAVGAVLVLGAVVWSGRRGLRSVGPTRRGADPRWLGVLGVLLAGWLVAWWAVQVSALGAQRQRHAGGAAELVALQRAGRRRGVMEQLYVAVLEQAAREGATGVDLGLAPFSGLTGQPGVPAKMMQLLYDRGGVLLNYSGLRAFKDQWSPRWEPRYLVTTGTW